MSDENTRYAEEIFPTDYASWRSCIEVKCGQPLTAEFLQQRIAVFSNPANQESRRFAELYGKPYHQQVLSWFERAAGEV